MTQKLSINLKRLNSAYTSCQNSSDKGEDNTSSSDEHSEQVPDFPPPNSPLVLRANTQTVSSALGADGKVILFCFVHAFNNCVKCRGEIVSG